MKASKFYRVELYLPTVTKGGIIINEHHLLRNLRDGIRVDAIAAFCSHAGGCTQLEGKGVWVDPSNGMVHSEDVSILTAYIEGRNIADFVKFLKCETLTRIKVELDQSMALAFVGGEMVSE